MIIMSCARFIQLTGNYYEIVYQSEARIVLSERVLIRKYSLDETIKHINIQLRVRQKNKT